MLGPPVLRTLGPERGSASPAGALVATPGAGSDVPAGGDGPVGGGHRLDRGAEASLAAEDELRPPGPTLAADLDPGVARLLVVAEGLDLGAMPDDPVHPVLVEQGVHRAAAVHGPAA